MNYIIVYRLNDNLLLIEDKIFLHQSDAEYYVIIMNCKCCAAMLEIQDCNDIDIIVDRCINNKWRDKQQYFIGKPNLIHK